MALPAKSEIGGKLPAKSEIGDLLRSLTVRHRGIGTVISEASKRVPILLCHPARQAREFLFSLLTDRPSDSLFHVPRFSQYSQPCNDYDSHAHTTAHAGVRGSMSELLPNAQGQPQPN